MKKRIHPAILIIFVILFCVIFSVFSYVKLIPDMVSNQKLMSNVEKILSKSFDIDVEIKNPVLKTGLNTDIAFRVEFLNVHKNDIPLIKVENFDSEISFDKLYKKNIKVKHLTADYIFVDTKELSNIKAKKEDKKKEKSDWKMDIADARLYVKKSLILLNPAEDISLKIYGKDIEITENHNPKFLKFKIKVELNHGKDKLVFHVKDNNKVFFADRTFFVRNCDFYVNMSKITINYEMSEKQKFNLKVNSENFNVDNIIKLLETNLIVPNGDTLLNMFDNINGTFSFNADVSEKDFACNFDINKINFKVKMVNNIPITLSTGNIFVDKEKITLNDVNGFYGKNSKNKIHLAGDIDDYTKTFKAKLSGYMFAYSDLTTDYLSPMINYPIKLVGQTISKIDINMLGSKIDLTVIFRLKKGCDILVDGQSLTPTDYERGFKADMTLDGNRFTLKDLNYYIAKSFTSGVKANPLLKLYGNFRLDNSSIENLGFQITKPLPSEFLNVLIGSRIFRKGKISGNLEYIATKGVPYLDGNLNFDEVRVPSQRLSINKGRLTTSQKSINLDILGKYRRTEYHVAGKILNEMKLPMVVNDINCKLANLDIENIIQSIQKQQEIEAENNVTLTQHLTSQENLSETEDDSISGFIFPRGTLIVEKCLLNIVSGSYKLVKFGNVNANMTLDKNGIFELISNKFDIADGTSSAHVFCDLVNQKYDIKLGVKDVDSDKIATSLLNLPREVSGLASGIIHLNSDKNYKLNGTIKFDIKKGTIAKIGLVEYVLNFVALFRNPIAMITPAIFVDLVNVPEGNFDKIYGSIKLKDNNISGMMIKSTAPQLSSFMVGKYDIENSDASLRIYTKFSNRKKGAAGILRGVSLNSLANRMPLSLKNDVNYYEAELKQLPDIDANEKDCQVFLTTMDGDIEHNNFLSSLKRIK